MEEQSNQVTVLLLDGSTVKRTIKQYNGAYYIRHLRCDVPVVRDKVVDGKQTYKEVKDFRSA